MLLSIFVAFIFATVAADDKFQQCIEVAASLVPIVKSINVTDRFFRSPEEYKAYGDKCEEIFNCFKTNYADQLPKIKEKMSPCQFYMFYNRDFSECAHKLIAKKDDNIPCLNTLFNDVHEPDVDECDQWESLQPCVQEQIGKLCDEKMVKLYIEQERNLKKEICEDD